MSIATSLQEAVQKAMKLLVGEVTVQTVSGGTVAANTAYTNLINKGWTISFNA